MLVDGTEVDVGMIVQFRTLNPKDPNIRQGHVIGIANYDIAKNHMDVVKYQQEVLENSSYSGEENAANLNFLIIKTDDSSVEIVEGESREVTGIRIYAFAPEWVEPTTLAIIDAINVLNFKIYGAPDSEAETIVQLLRDNGYKTSYVVS